MIKVQNFRANGGPEEAQSECDVDLKEAMDRLLRYELAFGGKISTITAETLEVKTRVLDCFDRTVFSGTKEEMEPLFASAALYLEAEKKVNVDELLLKVGEVTGGKPLLVAMATPLLQGQAVFEQLKTMLIKW